MTYFQIKINKRNKEIFELVKSGLSYIEISEELNISYATVVFSCKKEKMYPLKKSLCGRKSLIGQENEIVNMINSVVPIKEIAKNFNLTRQRIQQIAKKNNIDPTKLKRNKCKIIAQEINNQIKHGTCYVDVYKNYDKPTLSKLKRHGLELLYKSRLKRDRKIALLYKKGLTAKEILSIGMCGISSVDTIYAILKKQNAARNPHVIRGEKGLGIINEDKKILNIIKKLKGEGLSFQKISDYLNEKNYKTITGKKFSDGLTYAKYKQSLCKKTT